MISFDNYSGYDNGSSSNNSDDDNYDIGDSCGHVVVEIWL